MSIYALGSRISDNLQFAAQQAKTLLCRKATYVASSVIGSLGLLAGSFSVENYLKDALPPLDFAASVVISAAVTGGAAIMITKRWRDETRLAARQKYIKEAIQPVSSPVNRTALLCLNESDHNGAFRVLPPTTIELANRVRIIPIWSCGAEDLAQKVEAARVFVQKENHPPINLVFVEGHGEKNWILQGDSHGSGSYLFSKDLIRIFHFLPQGSDLITNACSTGQPGGLCESTAKGLQGVRVYGASTSISSKEPRVYMDSTSGKVFPVYFQRNRDVTEVYDAQGKVKFSEAELRKWQPLVLERECPFLALDLAARFEKMGCFNDAYSMYLAAHCLCEEFGALEKADKILAQGLVTG